MDIQSQLKYMPDQALAQEVHNPSGLVPSYLALAELNKRNKLREGSAQMPQGTVADKILGSLKSAGVPVQQQQPAPQGIAGAMQPPPSPGPATSFRSGGIVRLAGQGTSQLVGDNPNTQDVQMPTLAQAPTLPDAPTLQGAANDIQSVTGPQQDYSEVLNGIRSLRNTPATGPLTDADRSQLAMNLMAGSTAAGPMQALYGSKNQAWATQRELNSQYNTSMEKSYDDQAGVQEHMDQRGALLAKNAMEWQSADEQQQMARATEPFKNAQLIAKLQLDKARLDQDWEKNGNTTEGAINNLAAYQKLANEAAAAGDPGRYANAQSGIKRWQAVVQQQEDAKKTEKQNASDIDQKRESAIEGLRVAGQKSVADHNDFLKKNDFSGPIDWTDPNAITAQKKAQLDIQKGTIAQPPGRINSINANAWKAYSSTIAASQAGGQEIAGNAIDWASRRAGAVKLGVASATTEASSDAMKQQIPIINQTAQNITKRTGVTAFDEKWINAQAATGDADATVLRNQMETFSHEFARLQGGGTESVSGLAEGRKLFTVGLNGGQRKGTFDWVSLEADSRNKGYQNTIQKLRSNYGSSTPQGAPAAAPGTPATPPGTVKMQSPDGQVVPVPVDQVEHYKSRGATVVQ